MTIARISGPGLAAIAVAVALLWGCLVAERLIVRRANYEAGRTLRDMRTLRLRQHTEPASVPAPRIPRPFRIDLG